MGNKKLTDTVCKLFLLFSVGGVIYHLIEILWRGYSHVSMYIVGGLCFVFIGAINNYLPWRLGIIQQSLIGSILVTIIEFISGMIINKWLGLGVWDYSNQPFNLYGQICLLFSVIWIPLSAIAIFLDDWVRYLLFGEEKPHYNWI